MSRPQSASSAELSDPAAESPIVTIKIFKDGSDCFVAVSGRIELIAFGATPEEAAEAFVADASFQVQRDREMGRSGLIDVSKEEDPDKKLEQTLRELMTDLDIDDEQLHSSFDVQLKLEPLEEPQFILIKDALAAMNEP